LIIPATTQSVEAVARHYDTLDRFYREVWGDHVHHGLWRSGRESPAQAAVALVELLAERLALQPGQRVCDVGCGYGATSELLVKNHGVEAVGVTVSGAQWGRATARAADEPALSFARQDWLDNDFGDAQFERVFSIESSEHMADKQRFFDEAFRTLRPGGRLGVYAWLARTDARPWEVRYLLEPICREGRLPSMGTEAEYRDMAEAAGFAVESFEDLSPKVRRTWSVCIWRVLAKLATDESYRRFLRDAQADDRIFAMSLLRIFFAYRTGSMRYGLLIASKPR
jgi:tocopherol O-methyltransferase